MGEIVQFRPRVKQENSNNRIEALMRGQLETYICDVCGGEFDVLYGNFPDECPHCHRTMKWS